MSIGVEKYGYPKATIIGKNPRNNTRWVRITQGWFFWDDEDKNSCATYIDLYVNQDGEVDVILSDTTIFFDFVTPLDDYLLPCSKTISIGDLYQELEKELCVKAEK